MVLPRMIQTDDYVEDYLRVVEVKKGKGFGGQPPNFLGSFASLIFETSHSARSRANRFPDACAKDNQSAGFRPGDCCPSR